MKKLFALLLALVMVLPLVGCGPETEEERLKRSIQENQRRFEYYNREARDAIQRADDLQRARDTLGN